MELATLDDGIGFYYKWEGRWEASPFLSLDALVPVWEKLYFDDSNISYHGNEVVLIMVRGLMDEAKWERINSRELDKPSSLSIQEAVLISTAKAIQELQ